MLNASYYRKQAEICARLAKAAGSDESATRFKVLALEMLHRAEHAPNDLAEVAAASAAAICRPPAITTSEAPGPRPLNPS